MLILAVDTSTRMGSAALLRDDEVLAEVSGYEETPYSTRLFRDVEELQNRVNFRLHEIDLFAVAAGPGSFTGLRVGLTAVKAWAEVHQKPVAAISGLEAIAAESQTDLTGGTPSTTTSTTNSRYIASFLDARRGQIFGAVYRNAFPSERNLSIESDESILSPDEFLEMVTGKVVGCSVDFVSPTPEAISVVRLAEIFPGARVIPVSAALAPAIGRLGFERAKRGEVLDAIRLDANYVRRSDAEAAWKDG
jgi:tRNA threonylcarbamoyladenosine biosynthesis protein TsaB